MNDLTIGQLARLGEVGVETIRYYQRRGLLDVPDASSLSGYGRKTRRYTAEHARRLRFIRTAQAAGFTLNQIGELMTLDAGEDRERAHALAAERIAALDTKIEALKSARAALSRLASECASGKSGPCPIIASFEPHRA